MVNGRISKMFREIELIESTSLFHSWTPPATFVERQHQINRVWISPRMRPSADITAPIHLGARDHRIFVVDFPKILIMGYGFVPSCKPSMRILISCQPRAV